MQTFSYLNFQVGGILGVFLVIVVWIIGSSIFGIATNMIISNRGYQKSWFWFWCGFFFGYIAMLVALSKPVNRDFDDNYDRQVADEIRQRDILDAGGWKCPDCGRLNENFATTCACGRNKDD